MKRNVVGTAVVAVVLMVVVATRAKEYNYTITIGYSYPAKPTRYWEIGESFMDGVNAALTESNMGGDMPPLSLHAINDNGVVSDACANVLTFVKLGRFAVIGPMGYALSEGVLEYVTARLNATLPVIAPMTGIVALRHPWNDLALKLRQTYSDDIVAFVDFLLNGLHLYDIGIFYRLDESSLVQSLLSTVLKGVSLELGPIGTYDPTEDITAAFESLHSKKPDVIVMVGDAAPILKFIRAATDKGWSPVYLCISLEIDVLVNTLLEFEQVPENVYVSIGISTSNSSKILTSYRAALRRIKPLAKATYIGLEGFVSARFFIDAMRETLSRHIGGVLTQKDVLNTIFVDHPLWMIDDVTLGPFAPCNDTQTTGDCGCNQGLRTTYLLHIRTDRTIESVWKSPHHHPGCGNDIRVTIEVQPSIFSIILPPIFVTVTSIIPIALFFFFGRQPKALVLPKQAPVVVGSLRWSSGSGGPAAASSAPAEPFHISATAEVLGTTHSISTIPAEDLSNFRLIGSGASARVYRAVWRGTVVAVKQLHNAVDLGNAGSFQDLSAEIKLWSQLRHPHIVQFLGVTPDLWLVMEYMDRGSLRTLMKQRQLASNTRLRLLMQVALAMDYLHSRHVLHRDLNPNNIMVCGPYENLQAKVADFGLSRLGETLFQTKTVGTPVFAAPEVLVSGSFSTKSDAYSFGITMWFTETEQDPFEDLQSHFELVQAVVKNGNRPDITKCVLLPDLVVACWHQNPESRPAFSAIAATLQRFLHQDPIEMQ